MQDIEMHNDNDISWLLQSYAAGGLSYASQALVQSHLQMTDANHDLLALCETAICDGIETISEEEIISDDICWMDKGLEAIFSSKMEKPVLEDNPAQSLFQPITPIANIYPDAIRSFFESDLEKADWKKRMAGFSEIRAHKDLGDARLLRISPGKAMPHHTHEGGVELTLILKGSFHDGIGHYQKGDICIAYEGLDHKPVAGVEEECICFAVSEGLVRLPGLLGKILSPVVKY